MHALGTALSGRDWRYNVQANDWIGHEFANVLGLDAKHHKRFIESLMQQLLNQGALEQFAAQNKTRKNCPYIRVKDWSKATCATSQSGAEQGSAAFTESAPPPPLFMGGDVAGSAQLTEYEHE